MIRLSLVFTAVYFAVSALPIFLWLRERAESRTLPSGKPLHHEPIVCYGTFVMNMREEIKQTLRGLREGTFV